MLLPLLRTTVASVSTDQSQDIVKPTQRSYSKHAPSCLRAADPYRLRDPCPHATRATRKSQKIACSSAHCAPAQLRLDPEESPLDESRGAGSFRRTASGSSSARDI